MIQVKKFKINFRKIKQLDVFLLIFMFLGLITLSLWLVWLVFWMIFFLKIEQIIKIFDKIELLLT